MTDSYTGKNSYGCQPRFQKTILKSEYNTKIAGYIGINKILEFIT